MARTPKGFSSVANEYREAYEEGPEALRRFQAKERARSGDAALRKLNKREADRRANMPAPIEDRSVPIPKTVKKTKTATKAKFGVGNGKTVMHNGRSMANVTADQLKKTGLTLSQYMNSWDKTGARPAAGANAENERIKRRYFAYLKDKYKDAAVPKRGGTGESPNVKALRKYAKLEAARRADTREDAEKVENKPWWRFEKGGLVPKSIDGIATKGKTRAKHR